MWHLVSISRTAEFSATSAGKYSTDCSGALGSITVWQLDIERVSTSHPFEMKRTTSSKRVDDAAAAVSPALAPPGATTKIRFRKMQPQNFASVRFGALYSRIRSISISSRDKSNLRSLHAEKDGCKIKQRRRKIAFFLRRHPWQILK